MKAFVTGASGYIGSAVVGALARRGHDVYGLVRSDEGARSVASVEATPVMGDMRDPSTFADVASRCQILVHCAAEYSAEFMALDRRTVDALLEAAKKSGMSRTFIYTSGVWLYGNTGDEAVDETSRVNPPTFVAARAEVECRVMGGTAGAVRTIVIRPGCVYGGSGSPTAQWFESAAAGGGVRVLGEGTNRWAMIHREDLADLYARAAESSFGAEIFNATDRSRSTVMECARAASKAAGSDGKVVTVSRAEAEKEMGAFVEGLLLDQHVDSSKAARLLGWQPRHGGFADGARRYHLAWKASRAVR